MAHQTQSVGPVVRLIWRAAALSDGMREWLGAPSQSESVSNGSNGKVSRKQTQLGSGGGCCCAPATPTHSHTQLVKGRERGMQLKCGMRGMQVSAYPFPYSSFKCIGIGIGMTMHTRYP